MSVIISLLPIELCLLFASFYNGFNYIWLLFFLLCIMISTASSGIIVDSSSRKYKSYILFAGIKFGIWQSYRAYPYISLMSCVHRTDPGFRVVFWNNPENKEYEICLLNETHRKKVVLFTYGEKKKVQNIIEPVSEAFGLPIVEYRPMGGIYVNNGDVSSFF